MSHRGLGSGLRWVVDDTGAWERTGGWRIHNASADGKLKPNVVVCFGGGVIEKLNGDPSTGETVSVALIRPSVLSKSRSDTDIGVWPSSGSSECSKMGVGRALDDEDELPEEEEGLRSGNTSEPNDDEREADDEDRDGVGEDSEMAGLARW